jgi:sec-independent protein translocase protein TatB
MFDMSWGEVLVIGAVALIVIGPKDLPKALRTLGNMTSQVKKMASEFQSQFNEAMREAELDDIKKEVSGLNEQVSAFNPLGTIHDELKGAIEATPAANAAVAAPDAPAAEPTASAAEAPLPGEPAFDLALPAPPPALSGPLPEPVDATAAAGPVPAESPKA